jgi:hypothetical protein
MSGQIGTRAGVTLPELILVAWLFALALLGLARFTSAQGRLAALGYDRVRVADAARAADLVLGGELRYTAAPDRTATTDSVRIRAVRGAGPLCGRDGAEVRVRYRGFRAPDPEKDSVLLITGSDTRGSAHAVTASAPDSTCGSGVRLTLDPPPPSPAGMALVFETGSYHLTGGALRYRRGRGGRQPLTEALLRDGWFEPGPATLVARMVPERDSLPRLGSATINAVIRLLNPAGPP